MPNYVNQRFPIRGLPCQCKGAVNLKGQVRKDTERQELIQQEALSSFIDFMVHIHHKLYHVEIDKLQSMLLTHRNLRT